MEQYKVDFAKFLITTGALTFGEFTLKSGRKSPYFLNTGGFDDGEKISRLGYFYASAITANFNDSFEVVFGPSYKGIPLAVTSIISLQKDFLLNKKYTFNRKEEKDHAEKGFLVGYEVRKGDRIITLDDVFTTGETKVEMIEMFKKIAKVEHAGLVIALDRMEKNADGENAIEKFTRKYGVPVKAIITIREVVEAIHNKEIDGKVWLGDEEKKMIEDYLSKYGV